MGKCMYSGESIDLARLAVDYDIDHIYPQSAVKDDSLDNRVLVKRELNAAKKDRYPLAEDVRKAMRPFWAELKKRGFISDEKYRRLTRNTPFTDSERADFIARQLVETGQAAKIVAGLLKRRYGDDRVVYVKAGNVSAFRQAQRLLPDGRQVQEGSCRGKNVENGSRPAFRQMPRCQRLPPRQGRLPEHRRRQRLPHEVHPRPAALRALRAGVQHEPCL